MNVAGGVPGGVGFLMIVIPLIPFLIILVMRNLGLFDGIEKLPKIILYVLCFVVLIGLHLLILSFFEPKSVLLALSYFAIYWLAATAISFLFRTRIKNVLRQAQWILGILTIVLFPLIYFIVKPIPDYVNPQLEKQLVNTLQLKLIMVDSLLDGRVKIKGDTISGYRGSFFVRSIGDLKFRKSVDSYRPPYFEFTNGFFYSGGNWKNDIIKKVDLDSNEYDVCAAPINVERYMIFRNMVALYGNGEFSVYDELNKNVLFDTSGYCTHELMGDKLIYQETSENSLIVKCFSLDQMRELWTHNLGTTRFRKNDLASASEFYVEPAMLEGRISVGSKDHIRLLDANNGEIAWEYPLGDTASLSPLRYLFDKTYCYLNSGSSVICVDMKSNVVKWKAKNATLMGLNKNHIVLSTLDEKKIYVLNRTTGSTQRIIRNSSFNEVRFLGKYMLLPHQKSTALYQ